MLFFVDRTTSTAISLEMSPHYKGESLIDTVVGLAKIVFGLSIFNFYSEASKMIFRPLHKACKLTLQGQVRSSVSPLRIMTINIILPCILILCLSYVMFALKQNIHNQVTSAIAKSTYENDGLVSVRQQIQNIYETMAFHYAVSMYIAWENIPFFAQVDGSAISSGSFAATFLQKIPNRILPAFLAAAHQHAQLAQFAFELQGVSLSSRRCLYPRAKDYQGGIRFFSCHIPHIV